MPACCMDSSGMGGAVLALTDPGAAAESHTQGDSSFPGNVLAVVCAETNISPLPPPLSASPVSCVASPSCIGEMRPAWPQPHASGMGSEAGVPGATEGLRRGPCSVRTWKIQACFSPPRQEKGLSTTPGLACTWSGGPSFHKYLLSTALCKHHGRHVNTVMNGTAALAFPFDVKRTLFKMCDSMSSNTFTGVRPSPLSISVAVSSSPRKSPRAFGGHSQSPLHLQPGALRGSACSTRVV